MQSYEAAATPIPPRELIPGALTLLVGDRAPADVRPLPPYAEPVCDFLAALSREILGAAEARRYPDVVTFGFWCRRSNIAQLKARFQSQEAGAVRRGLGLVFHVAPSNVPVSFAYSCVLGMLAGNANIVRAPSRDFAQVRLVCDAMEAVLGRESHAEVRAMTAVVRYERDLDTTSYLSSMCQGRVLWGGDQSVRDLRRIPLPPRAVELTFADRYSLCVLDAERLLTSDHDMRRLAAGFYNDVYVIDQNACNSPHVVLWLGREKAVAVAARSFWDAVHDAARAKYSLEPIVGMDKFTQLCVDAVQGRCAGAPRRYGNLLYVVPLNGLPRDLDAYRGVGGYFYEARLGSLDALAAVVNDKFQTLTYAGLDREEMVGFVTRNRLAGIDRIVPVGRAMEMSVVWDGYDTVRALSRICEIE
jgi:hypothetical protein